MADNTNAPPPCAPEPSESWIRILEDHETTDSIIDGLRDGIILHDADGCVIRINRSMERILGISRDEAHGRDVSDLFGGFDVCSLSVDPENPDAELLRKTRNIRGREYEVDCTPAKVSRPGKHFIITVLHDVTEKVNLERQRTEVLSMVSHDVRGPLTTILGYCELILTGNMGESCKEINEGVEAVMRSGRKVLDIIEDFLVVAKAEAGKLNPAFTLADISGLCSGVADTHRPEAERLGKRIECRAAEGLPKVECDPKLIDRVVTNLVDNAIKYSGKGGNITVEVSALNEDEVEIAVADDGMGIPEDEMSHLFERYWRGSRVSDTKGSGLGLSIVKRLVDMHNGTVSVESVEREGTTVRVRLPVEQP